MRSAPITGYRELSEAEVYLINEIKEAEIELGSVWKQVSDVSNVDKRWLAIAKTHFQEGFSALVRSVAQPEDVF